MELFRKLDEQEEEEFRQWARDTYEPLSKINDLWHPVVQDECVRMNEIHTRTESE